MPTDQVEGLTSPPFRPVAPFPGRRRQGQKGAKRPSDLVKPKQKKRKKRNQTPALRRKAAFLLAFRKTCDVTAAAAAVKIDRHLHYDWLDDDPKYKAEFKATEPEVNGLIEDTIARLGLKGYFEPNIYKGEFVYARRNRTMCLLSDGTSVFEEELPEGATIVQRKAVQTRDGEQLGVWYIDTAMLGRLAAARMPERYGNQVAVKADVTITSPDEARNELAAKLATIAARLAGAPPAGDPKQPE